MSDSRSPYLWAEEGEARHVLVANVVPKAPIERIYAYTIPNHLQGQVQPGHRVRVPFGKSARLVEGFVLDIATRPWDTTLRPVAEVVDENSWLAAPLLSLGRWISEYYAAPLGPVLAAMVPAAIRRQSGFERVRWVRLTRPAADLKRDARRMGPRQRQLLENMPAPEQEVEVGVLRSGTGLSDATLRQALASGWLSERREKRPRHAPVFELPLAEPDFELNEDQQQACATISERVCRGGFEVLLLHGVSGSGKTEVYIQVMRRALERVGQVILLVPEIALTTQLVQRFASRFRDIAVLHSGLTDAQRGLTWHAIRAGQRRVVIGTRSAVFAPCPQLALIIIDEEQDNSFKNQPLPRFHARDVAVYRARLQGVPVILGSATPSLETYYNSRHKDHYRAIELPRRVAGLELPEVELVDVREESHARRGVHLLSRTLETRLAEALRRREQAVLFLNQRGYASAMFCPRCKARVLCPNCRSALVLHTTGQRVRCHYCHRHFAVPELCPDSSCGSRLLRFGVGTERVEEEVRQKFPDARVARVDSDSMTGPPVYKQVLQDFYDRRLDVMVGTQIVAKGLDFPGVSLVGVISADTALFQPDFRANERTFQLVTQVAGRAGRASRRGHAVVQTLMSDLPALQAAIYHDYERFALEELQTRRQMSLPPFSRLARWIVQDPVETQARDQACVLAGAVRRALNELHLVGAEVLGPHPSPLERLRGLYRFDVLLRAPDTTSRAAALRKLRFDIKPALKVKRVTLDVDPISLL